MARQAGITGSKAEELACEEAEPHFWQVSQRCSIQMCAQLENIRWEDRLVSKPVKLSSESSLRSSPPHLRGADVHRLCHPCAVGEPGLRNLRPLILHFSCSGCGKSS